MQLMRNDLVTILNERFYCALADIARQCAPRPAVSPTGRDLTHAPGFRGILSNEKQNIMAHLRAAHILAIPFAAMVATSACNTRAFADDLPPPSEPMLAERGDWAADFNQAQITCFKGSMSACDAIWLSKRVLMDTFLYNYGRTCGGRVSLGELRRAGAFRLGGPSLHCTEIFPGHE
jgi:hypothetical protein